MTTERKNYYEELIDKMMIDEVSGIDNDIRETLENLPMNKKRLAILSILDKDRGLFAKIKNMINSNELTKVEYIKELVKMLREYVKVGDVEVKKHGEVMTPITLVEEMMDTLPNEVWSNPDLKWLDPCSGVGIFSAVIVDRLMDGLSVVIPNENDRYKHIMENMIHVGELQPKNMFLFLVAFDPKDEYMLNIYCGSYLDNGFDEHKKEVWGVDKFDVVVMNPPYNSGSANRGSAHVLWNKFVLKTLENDLVEGGYLCAVHPSGWRNVDGGFKDVQIALREREIQYLNMNTSQDGIKTFGVTTAYDFYCIKNVFDTDIKTKIISINNEIERVKLKNVEFIPNCNLNEIYSLVANNNEDKVEILRSCIYHTQKEYISTNKTNLPCIYSIKQNGEINLRYTSINKGHFGIPKIILGNGANPTYVVDERGEYGITQFAYAIIDDPKNFKYIERFLNSEKVKEITRATKFVSTNGNPIIYPKIIALFRKDFWKDFI